MKVERAIPLLSPAYDQGKTEVEIRESWLRYWETLYLLKSEGASERT